MTATPPPPGAAPSPAPGAAPAPKSNTWKWACGGCGGCGCLTAVALTIAFFVCGQFLFDSLMAQAPLPPGEFTPTEEDRQALEERLATDLADWEGGAPVAITLSERDANILAQRAVEERGDLHTLDVAFTGDRIRLRVSITPQPEAPAFLNVVYAGTLQYRNGVVTAAADELRIGARDWTPYVDGQGELGRAVVQSLVKPSLDNLRRTEGIEVDWFEVQDSEIRLQVRRLEETGP
jgi:hypothetical protein